MYLLIAGGTAVGLTLGLTGAGGGILAVPALMAATGWPLQQASPIALIAVAAGAALGAWEGFRHRLVRYRAALLMMLAGLPFTSLGVQAARLLPQPLLLGLFALVMLVVAARLLRGQGVDEDRPATLCRLHPDTGRFHWTPAVALLFAGIGATTGFLTGLLGVGGGFVIVPALRRFTPLSMHGIVATSLLVVALVGSGSVISALAHGAKLPPAVTLPFLAATLAGMLLGHRLIHRLTPTQVQHGFAAILMLVAASLLFKAWQLA